MKKSSFIFFAMFFFFIFPLHSFCRGPYVLYRVKRGDTLSSISKRFSISQRRIMAENHIKNPHSIRAGTTLRIPVPSRFHLAWPAKGKVVRGFGIHHGIRNNGIDIALRLGTPVRASGSGVVVFSGFRDLSKGVVIVDHGRGLKTVYGFLSKVSAKKGMRVRKGQVLGYSGFDPSTLEPSLHFEVRFRGVPIDPLKALKGSFPYHYGGKSR